VLAFSRWLWYNIPINNKKGHMMKKLIILFFTTYLLTWGMVSCVKADEYNTAVIGHVITQTVQGNKVDTSVLEAEMAKIFHAFALEMTMTLEKNLPNILDSLAAQLRLKADSKYNCSLLKDTTITDKECS
jgi:hypothetical protein